jgi:hypothetical protein
VNLGSSRQMDVLTGDNRDVLGQQLAAGGGGWGFSGGGRGRARGMGPRDPDQDVARVELALDVAIFADGLCVGPDESGLRQSLIEQIKRQKEIAGEIVSELRRWGVARPYFRNASPAGAAQTSCTASPARRDGRSTSNWPQAGRIPSRSAFVDVCTLGTQPVDKCGRHHIADLVRSGRGHFSGTASSAPVVTFPQLQPKASHR